MKSPWKERETVNVREGGVGRVRKFPAVFPEDSFISWSVGRAFGRSVRPIQFTEEEDRMRLMN